MFNMYNRSLKSSVAVVSLVWSLLYCGTNSLKSPLLGKACHIVFRPVYKLNDISKLKSKLANLSKSQVVYKVNCTN